MNRMGLLFQHLIKIRINLNPQIVLKNIMGHGGITARVHNKI
jgi:hypothetical protein